MEKFAKVKFIGNPQVYLSGKDCDEWRYCQQCSKVDFCVKEKLFLFLSGKEYKAYFLDYCQGVRDVLDVEAENGELLSFVDACDFEVISDEHNVLHSDYAIVKCIKNAEFQDLQQGKEYIALKQDKSKTMFYVLDDSSDCYYYPKELFIVLEDAHKLLSD